ncbi:MAG: PQQ-binding-like beta-propeller repeat protein [Cyanobacteria bacterium HKST-UBA01]|nr:PQQ-binding-like beta-propeller repeat protein [Cyanobacteria bacterium HKST-UBA01]
MKKSRSYLLLSALCLVVLSSCSINLNQPGNRVFKYTAPRDAQWSGYGIGSSPVVAGNYILYVAGYHWQNRVYLFVIDQTTGKEIWHSKEPVQNFEVSGDLVIATTRTAIQNLNPGKERTIEIVCYNLKDGAVLWRKPSSVREFEPRIIGAGVNFYFWMPGFEVYALDKQTGDLKWRIQKDSASSPMAISTIIADGDTIYSATPGDSLLVFDGVERKTRNVFSMEKVKANLVTGLKLLEGKIAAIDEKNGFWLLDPENGSILFHEDSGVTFRSLYLKGERLTYIKGKTLHCINLEDGKELWQKAFPGKIANQALISGNHLYQGTAGSDPHFYCLDLTDGHIIWKTEIGAVRGNVIEKDGVVYLSSQKEFLALSGDTGEILWRSAPDQYEPGAGPVLGDNKILFVGQDSNLYGYKLIEKSGTKSSSATDSKGES